METNVWVICQIWTWFIRGRSGGRGLPARDIDSVEVLCHLGEHGWFQTSISITGILVLHHWVSNCSMKLSIEPGRERERGHTLNLASKISHSFLLCTLEGY